MFVMSNCILKPPRKPRVFVHESHRDRVSGERTLRQAMTRDVHSRSHQRGLSAVILPALLAQQIRDGILDITYADAPRFPAARGDLAQDALKTSEAL